MDGEQDSEKLVARTIMIPEWMVNKLERQGKGRGQNLSAMVRWAIGDYLDAEIARSQR